MLSAGLGHFLDKPLGAFFKRVNLNPNFFTLTGFLITSLAAVIIPFSLFAGGLFILFGGMFDMLDGVAARTNGRVTRFGAFLDSFLDRISDALIFLSVAWHLNISGDGTGALLSIGALIAAFLVSYARARSEGLGMSNDSGLMERPERIILLVFAALTGWLHPVLWIIFLLTAVTVVQRVYAVWAKEEFKLS